jgi:neural Wiskott-Aldrich syndrome protein
VQNRYPRTIYCDGGLWQALERVAYERQRPVDDLIEEALGQFIAGSGGVQPVNVAPTARPPPGAPAWPQQPAMPPPPRPPAQTAPLAPPRAPSAPAPSPPRTPAPGPGIVQRGGARVARPMFVDYAGYRYPVAAERFIIGRSRKECDLAIADTNISRQHALVEWFNGCFHIVDMGSTNGIEFNGQRVYRRIIRDGDVFHIAGHELRFGFS